MFGLFNKKNLIHEPLENQISDVKKLNPLIANEILQGLSCDKLPNATGDFGSITNPIPVNGQLGEIKYLGKLRGKTGHAVFFHRIGSTISSISKNPIDLFELVCHDATQWNKLYLDPYHPRRSNHSPEGYKLIPYKKEFKMDLPFAYGVTSLVANFPYDLPKELDEFYGGTGAFSRHAQKWLEEYSFQRPTNEQKNQNEEKQKTIKTSDDIDNYSFITDILNESLAIEKDILTNHKDKLMGYTNPKLFDSRYNRMFLIERFIFLRAYLQWEDNHLLNTEDMYRYVAAIATKIYHISHQQAYQFLDKRQKLYLKELEMLKEFKHPHPGKIIWCLHNPTNSDINHEMTSCFENNIVAGLFY
jgi:hypothetical protein